MYENPSEVRALIRQGKLIRPTAGMVPGYAQAKPGDKVRFQSIELAQAVSLLKEREKSLPR